MDYVDYLMMYKKVEPKEFPKEANGFTFRKFDGSERDIKPVLQSISATIPTQYFLLCLTVKRLLPLRHLQKKTAPAGFIW